METTVQPDLSDALRDGKPWLGGTLEHAIELATGAHDGQLDKQGQPYILHPLRVMLSLRGEQARIVGVLHDVLEDCLMGEREAISSVLAACFDPEVVIALDLLTRDKVQQTYAMYIHRVEGNALATEVKMADLRDNLSRLDGLNHQDKIGLGNRYRWALAYLTQVQERRYDPDQPTQPPA